MKKLFKSLAVLTFAVAIFACQSKTVAEKPVDPAEKRTYKAVGVVRAIDPAAGKITLDHEDIAGYMPAMQMNEAVSDAKMLEAVRVGDRVEFEIERTGAQLVVTKLDKIGETLLVGGGEIYKTNCALCHGGRGEGDVKGISLLKGHALKHSENEYIEQVTNGEGRKMPPFKDKLAPEQIAAVVKFVREELQKDIPADQKTEHMH